MNKSSLLLPINSNKKEKKKNRKGTVHLKKLKILLQKEWCMLPVTELKFQFKEDKIESKIN